MLFEKHIMDFEESLQLQKFSERTISAYIDSVRKFTAFIEEYYKRIDSIDKITKDILHDYQKYIFSFKMDNGQHYSNSTQKCKLNPLKSFFKFLIKMDFILRDPSSVLTMPRDEQRLTRNILSQSEMIELLKSIKLNTPVNIRNRAIIELFYSCGIRTSELCGLKVNDIDLKNFTVTIIKGKGNKSRVLPIGQYSAYYIELYLDRSRKHLLKHKEDSGYLFLSQLGNPFNKVTINKTVIKSILRNINNNKHISCYSFRHSVASHLLENKVDIAYIAELLGHSSLKTTQKYLKIEISDLKKMHSRFHPREKN